MPTQARQLLSDFQGDHLSVKMFGAAADGVTDDTVACQAALDSVGTSITFPSGTYKLGQLVLRSTTPKTILAYGAVILPTVVNQPVLTVYGNYHRIFGLKFQGTGGQQYIGIQLTHDATTISTQHCLIQDVSGLDMYQGIWCYMDGTLGPGSACYRNRIVNCDFINTYLPGTWSGSFGVAFDGNTAGDSSGNDSRLVNCLIRCFENNVIVRKSVETRLFMVGIDGGTNGILYDGGSGLALFGCYMEANVNQIAIVNTPYRMSILACSVSNHTNIFTGSLLNGEQPYFIGPNDYFLPNSYAAESFASGLTRLRSVTGCVLEVDTPPSQVNTVTFRKFDSDNFGLDFNGIDATYANFRLSRAGKPLVIDSANLYVDTQLLRFGNAVGGIVLRLFDVANRGMRIGVTSGLSSNFNGVWIASNEDAAGAQANTGLVSWAVDIGGYDNITNPGSADKFRILRKGAGGAWQVLFTIDSSMGTIHSPWPLDVPSGGTAIQSYTKGDLLAASASTLQKLAVGSNGQVLTADSTVGQGVKWAAAAALPNVGTPGTYTNVTTDAQGRVTSGTTGLSATITTAKLTPTGSNGSMTFTGGLLTAQTQAT